MLTQVAWVVMQGLSQRDVMDDDARRVLNGGTSHNASCVMGLMYRSRPSNHEYVPVSG